MNNDLISRSELYAAIGKRIAERHGYFSLRDIKDAIDNAPTVPQTIITEFKGCDNCELERPQGEWVRVIDYSDEYEKRWHYECSECKNAPYYCGEIYKLHFCPNCGAEMKGGTE